VRPQRIGDREDAMFGAIEEESLGDRFPGAETRAVTHLMNKISRSAERMGGSC
jgi:hypothetical protein